MGLTFLHPAFLFGALAASVPVMIHLIYRRRALVHRFPAVRFLLLADKRTARKFRLHQWLLLALRVLAILLLILVLARPRLIDQDVQAAVALPAQATIVLLDNSLSMQYRDQPESRFQRAKAVAARFLQSLRPQDSAAVLPLLATDTEADTVRFLTHDRTTLQQHLTAMQPSHAAVNMVNAFQRALVLLHESPAPRHRLVLVSDFTVHGWTDFHLAQLEAVSFPERVELRFIRLGSRQRDANLLVTDLRMVEPPFIEGNPIEITAVVRNESMEAVQNVRIDLLMGQTKVGEQLVDLQPGKQVAVPFRITAPAAGLHWGEVRLQPDNFAADDRLYYALRTVSPVRILAVDGDPGTSLFASELFYFLSALQPAAVLGHALFYPKPVTWEGLGQERFSDYRVVVLCNVEALAASARQRLHQFVVAGGSVLFFAGNRVDADRYNAMWYHSDTSLLPLPLQSPLQAQSEQPMHIGFFEPTHAVLEPFAEDDALLQRGKFYRYMALQPPDRRPAVKVLLALEDGRPLLVEKPWGRGKVIFFASSADRDWTDLPTRTAYVPLLHSLLGYLANLSSATQRPRVTLSEPAFLVGRQVDLDTTVSFQTPDGQERLGRYTTIETQVVARFADYTVPGMYRVTTPSEPDLLAVNATRAESNFEKLQSTDLSTRFHPLMLTMQEEATWGQTSAQSQLPMRELSGIFMLALVAVLMVETICANRF